MLPPVAIVIPSHNAAPSIGRAIESALTQTHAAQEIIVADDGSTDDSVAVSESFGDKVRVLRLEKRGGNAARNQGLRAATADWIQFLDADDYLQSDKMALQLREAGDRLAESDVLYSPVLIETSSTGGATIEPQRFDPAADLFTQWITWQLPQTGGALWRKSALVRLGGWNESMPCCQEHELYLRALKAGLTFTCCPSPRAVYRIWSEETLCRRDPRQLVQVKTALLDDLAQWMESQQRFTSHYRQRAGQACFEMARTLAKLNIREAATYHADRRRKRMIHLDGPAAPPVYRIFYRLLGFAGAEHLARMLR